MPVINREWKTSESYIIMENGQTCLYDSNLMLTQVHEDQDLTSTG